MLFKINGLANDIGFRTVDCWN